MIVDKSKTMIRQKQNKEGRGGYTSSVPETLRRCDFKILYYYYDTSFLILIIGTSSTVVAVVAQ